LFCCALLEPVNTENYPKEATYVIIGAGTAAHAACRAIRKNNQNAKVRLFSTL